MRIFLALLFLIAPLAVSAQKAVRFKSVVARPGAPVKGDDFTAIFYLAQDYRFERNENMGYSPRRLMSLGFGLRFRENYLAFLEGGSFREATEVGNVRIDRKFETVNLSAALMTEAFALGPYFGAGIGMTRDTADITVDGSDSNSRSGWEPIPHFFGGIRFFPKTRFWASLEGKWVVGSRTDPNPTPGFLLRLGAEL